MVYIFGGDYPLTIIMPVFLIMLMLIFFLTTYIKDNISKLKLKLKHKHKKEEKKEFIDFHKEFHYLKQQVKKYTAAEALDAISSLTKRYVGDKLNINKEFTFEEIPRHRLSWQLIEFTRRLSDLKYSGKEITRPEIDHLMVYLSKILKFKDIGEIKEKKVIRLFPRIILPKFPKIRIKLPILKHIHVQHEEPKPIKLGISLPKRITINLSNLFKKPHKRLEEHEILERQQKIISLINQVRQNLTNIGKALKYYNKALEINNTLPKEGYFSKLKILHQEIIRNKEKDIQKKEIEIQKKIKIKEERKLSKIRNKILKRIKFAQKNIENYDKSLLSYKKSFELSKILPNKFEFKSELKNLYDSILFTKQKQIKLIQQEQERITREKEIEKQRQLKLKEAREKEAREKELEKQKESRLKQIEKEREKRQKELEKHNEIKLKQEEKQREIQIRKKAEEESLRLKQEKERQDKLRELERQRIIKLKKEEELKKVKLENEARLKENKLKQDLREKELKRIREEKEAKIKEEELEKQRKIKIKKLRKEKQIKLKQELAERKEREKERQIKLKELEEIKKLKDHIQRLVNYTEQNITNTNKALRYYNRAARLNRTLPKHEFSLKLKELHKSMLNTQEKKIQLEQEAKLKAIRESEREKQIKIKLKQEAREREELEEQRKIKLEELERHKKLRLKQEVEKEIRERKLEEQRQIRLEQEEKEKRVRLEREAKEKAIRLKELEKQRQIKLEQEEKERRFKIKRETREKALRERELEKQNRIKLRQEEELKRIKLKREAKERVEREEQRIIKLKKEAREKKEREKENKIRLKELEEQRKIKLKKEEELKNLGNEILKFINYAEQSILNLKPKKAIKYYQKALDLENNPISQHKFKGKLEKVHNKIVEYKEKPKEIPLPVVTPEKQIKHYKKHKSIFEKIRINHQASKVLKLIKKAERLSLRYPLISKRYYDRALLIYYNLPIEKEETISTKLSRYYDKINSNNEKELLNIKHTSKKETKQAIEHLKKYRNYVIIEKNSFNNILRDSINNVKKQVNINKTKDKKTKYLLKDFLKTLSKEEYNILQLKEQAIKKLLYKAILLLTRLSKIESSEAYETSNAIINLFSNLKVNYNLPRAPKKPMHIEIKQEIIPPIIHKEEIKEIKPPEIVVKKKPKIKIEPPQLPEKKISDRMRKLMEEKEDIYNKLNQLGEKELDRFKQTKRMSIHEDIGYRDFLSNLKPKSDLSEERRIKKLFEAK